jgi:serine/threonine protein kinase
MSTPSSKEENQAPEEALPSSPTKRVGRYRVGAKLGEGAFSDVYVGHDDATGETVRSARVGACRRLRQPLWFW